MVPMCPSTVYSRIEYIPIDSSGGCGHTFIDNPTLEFIILQETRQQEIHHSTSQSTQSSLLEP